MYGTGDLEAASSHAAAMLAPAKRSGVMHWQVNAIVSNEEVCRSKGEWQSARSLSERGLEIAPQDLILLGNRALLEYEAGEFDAGSAYFDRLLEVVQLAQLKAPSPTTIASGWYTHPAVVIPLVARFTGRMNLFSLSEAIAQAVLTRPEAAPAPVRAAQMAMALIAVQRDDKKG